MDDAELESAERAFIERARQGLSPKPAQLVRVRQSLQAALAATAAATVAGATPNGARGAAAAKGTIPPWASKLVLVAATAAAAGTTGFWAGYHAARRETPPMAARVSSAPSEGRSSITTIPSVETGPPSPPEPKVHPRVTTASRRAVNAAPARAAGTDDDSEASLANEVRGLRSVERALRDQRPGLALALLAALDREVPGGKLAEEREATSVIAHCALGQAPLGVDLAADFTERYPSSVYLERVRQSCATGPAARGQTDRGPSGD
jgi:hypothetical protein